MILLFTTSHKKETALKIGKSLLKDRLIACCNLLPVESAYWWKGEIVGNKEILMILKTRKENFGQVESQIKKHSGYEIPEVLAVTLSQVNKSYLDWIHSETKT